MIISKNTNPDKDLYAVGSYIIENLIYFDKNEIDFLELYKTTKKNNNVSMQLFSLGLSWLYLLGVVERNDYGKIVRCF